MLVAVAPRIGAWVVAAWLAAITVNLVLPPGSLRHRAARFRPDDRRDLARTPVAEVPQVAMARVVVVTGGSAGVGRAVAISFARRGAHVALSRGTATGPARRRRRSSSSAAARWGSSTDVASAAQVEAAADAVERELGPIDVWVNNAMATVLSPRWTSPRRSTSG